MASQIGSGQVEPRSVLVIGQVAVDLDTAIQRLARAEAFRLLIEPALDAAYRRAAVILGDLFEAEDAVHSAAEKAWRSWGSLRDPARFEGWFGRILVNECRDRLRRRRRVARAEVREPAVEIADPLAEVRLRRADMQAAVLDALAVLTADERIAIALRFEADLTVPRIAELTGTREGTVKSRLHHALQKLRVCLAETEAGQ